MQNPDEILKIRERIRERLAEAPHTSECDQKPKGISAEWFIFPIVLIIIAACVGGW